MTGARATATGYNRGYGTAAHAGPVTPKIHQVSCRKRQGLNVNRIGGRGLDQVTTILYEQAFYRGNIVPVLESGQKVGKNEFPLPPDDIIDAPGSKYVLCHELRMGTAHHHRPADGSHPAGDGERLAGPGRISRNPHQVGTPDIPVIQMYVIGGQIPYDHGVPRLFKAGGNIEQAYGRQTKTKCVKYAC